MKCRQHYKALYICRTMLNVLPRTGVPFDAFINQVQPIYLQTCNNRQLQYDFYLQFVDVLYQSNTSNTHFILIIIHHHYTDKSTSN